MSATSRSLSGVTTETGCVCRRTRPPRVTKACNESAASTTPSRVSMLCIHAFTGFVPARARGSRPARPPGTLHGRARHLERPFTRRTGGSDDRETQPRIDSASAGRMTAKPPTSRSSHRRVRFPTDHVERNPGMPLDLDFVRSIRVNRSAVERRAATIPTRRTVKKEWQAAWLLRAITLMDLTTLSGDDTRATCGGSAPRRATRCATTSSTRSASRSSDITVGAVCVYHALVPTAVEALEGSDIPVAAVSTGFPAGLSPDRAARRRDPRVGRRRREGDRHRHHARARAHGQLRSAVRRGEARSAKRAATRT